MLYTEIPTQRPVTPLLDAINHPEQLRALEQSQLEQVADELRQFILYAAGQSGGHFGANLGVIELTVALHYCFNTPHDRLIWDVGHQAYPHKVLTGVVNSSPRFVPKMVWLRFRLVKNLNLIPLG